MNRQAWQGRRWIVAGILVVVLVSAWHLGPKVVRLSEGADPWGTAGQFFAAAFSPAFADESPNLPDGATPFLERVGADLVRTVRYALVAMALALPLGLVFGFFASRAWWPGGEMLDGGSWARRLLRGWLGALRWVCRTVIILLRSVHELIWAMLFLSAIGDAPITACVALALPFAGTLAKVFSELIDESTQSARTTLLAAGATPGQAFFGALVPQAVPDLVTYSFYRLECALRSSAVLGFIGIETIGLGIRRSFENLYFHEVWTQLFALIALIVVVDRTGAYLRGRLKTGVSRSKTARELNERELKRTAPRDWLLRGASVLVVAAMVLAWVRGEDLRGDLDPSRQADRMARFVTKMTPEPVRPEKSLASWPERVEAWHGSDESVGEWALAIWRKPGQEALVNTVAISVAAVGLAGLLASVFLPLAVRTLAHPEPFGVMGVTGQVAKWLRQGVGFVVRAVFVVARAIPEYVLAFLLVGMLGPSAWPLVFALAIHNAGILGRLWGEVLENEEASPARQLRRLGATREQIYAGALLSQSFNRLLLFFFYRWETCIREATILGMLGIASLGYYISWARATFDYDRMVFFVLLGAVVVGAGDLLSDALRRKFRVVR